MSLAAVAGVLALINAVPTPHVSASFEPRTGRLVVRCGESPVLDAILEGTGVAVGTRGPDEGGTVEVVVEGDGALALRGEVFPGAGSLPVRLGRRDGPVFAMQSGEGASPLADACWSPERDVAIALGAPYGTAGMGTLEAVGKDGRIVLRVHPALFRGEYGLPYYAPRRRSSFTRAPAGWCSWYIYYMRVTEADVLANAEAAAEKLLPFGGDTFQIDDGYQLGRPPEGGGHLHTLDWLETNERFPHGLAWLAAALRERGLVPGIWTVIFAHNNAERFAADPAAYVRDASGAAIPSRWPGPYVFDPTAPGLDAHIEHVYGTLREWGFRYYKVDGIGMAVQYYETCRERLRNPSVSGEEAVRIGLRRVREAIGNDRFLLTSWGTATCALGLVDGARIGGDVAAKWSAVERARDALLRWHFTHDSAWFVDPDVFCVREPLTPDQARVWVTLVGLTGSVTLNSDNLAELPEDRLSLVRACMPTAAVRPVDLFPREGEPPAVWSLRVQRPFGAWDIAAVFNWSEETQRWGVAFDELGLAPGARYVGWDFWGDAPLGVHRDFLALTVPPTGCRLVALAPLDDRPRVVSTSRHVTQGAVDLREAAWDGVRGVLRGVSEVVAAHPYEIRVTLPEGLALGAVSPQPSAVRTYEAERCVAIAWASPAATTLAWEAAFPPADAEQPGGGR